MIVVDVKTDDGVMMMTVVVAVMVAMVFD